MEDVSKRKQRGITLIALVITIIVLLILAGVTINLTIGERGIFTTAQKAAQNYTNAQDKELAHLEDVNYDVTYVTTGSSEKEWNEEKQVNEPQIEGTGLQPIIIESGTGKVTEIKDSKMSWYNYQTTEKDGEVALKTWANAISKGTTSEYDSYWVWIPRYAYKLDKEEQTIDIVFLKGTTDRPAPTTANGTSSSEIVIKRASEVKDDENNENVYIVHPAFTDESENGYANGGWDREIPGFWIAKFEAGYVGEPNNDGNKAKDSPVKYTTIAANVNDQEEDVTTYYYGTRTSNVTEIKWPTFQPLRPSFNYIGISDAYELCRKIGGSTGGENPYQLSKVDSHLTKNSEWGAVAYLSYSDYGKGKVSEVTINSANANGTHSVWAVTGYSNISGSEISFESLVNAEHPASNVWYSSSGDDASTTGNVSGVYDISGGVWEWTAGYVVTPSEYYTIYGEKLKDETNGKYKSIYALTDEKIYDANENYNVEANRKRKGEAIWETSTNGDSLKDSWNSDISNFIAKTRPFTVRGGHFNDNTGAGVFTFNRGDGINSYAKGFRTVLVCE